MARALIVGCGCRGRELGRRLRDSGWAVRGTNRGGSRAVLTEEAGLEAVGADPERIATILDHVGDVALVFWLMGSVAGEPEAIEAIHGARLERLLEELVDTPVRGFVYEAGGSAPAACRERGAEAVRAASERWRIPVEIVDHDPADWKRWTERMAGAAGRLAGARA